MATIKQKKGENNKKSKKAKTTKKTGVAASVGADDGLQF